MGQLGIIIPSRSRPENIRKVYESWTATRPHTSRLIIALDEDDVYEYLPFIEDDWVTYEVNPRMRMVGTLNAVANKYCDEYRCLGFIGDDHRFRTEWWDLQVYNRLKGEGRNGILFCNDLLQGPNLPTAVFMNASIVKRLGYMVPPILIHMYADNFWKDLGLALDHLVYMDDIIIEHCHHVNGKAVHDAQYDEVNEFTTIDRLGYQKYLEEFFERDVTKLVNT